MKTTTHKNKRAFNGDKKIGASLLSGPENTLKKWIIPKIPQAIETYHLTMATLLWSIINVAVAFHTPNNLSLLWVISLMIALQYLTDLLDGELGRQRETGLVKWGFYMDHFLDYIFLCSLVFVGYMILPSGLKIWSFAFLVILGSFMVNSFLSFAATNAFEIYSYGIGPTEGRIILILVNTFILFFGTGLFSLLVPISAMTCLVGLIINTYQIQKKLWLLDMQSRQEKQYL